MLPLNATQALCDRCEAPFEPVAYHLPAPGGGNVPARTKHCPSCAATAAAEDAARARATRELRMRPLAGLLPVPGANEQTRCLKCGFEFSAETVIFRGDGKIPDKTLRVTICDTCAEGEKLAVPPVNATRNVGPTAEQRRAERWTDMAGLRYATFRPAELPLVIQGHMDRVMSWTPQHRGVGLLGASRTGKSPLLFGLARKLFMAGHDVFTTSGIEFQRAALRGVEEKADWLRYIDRCETAEILLVDDADKLNLTPYVEGEYYGMLEARRNALLPLLCTLNLSGDDFKALAKDRADRAPAIVERLRDLCEFISIKTTPKHWENLMDTRKPQTDGHVGRLALLGTAQLASS